MNAAKIEAKIQRGNGKAAKILGVVCDQYRAATSGPVMVTTNLLGIVMARFDQDFQFGARKPNLYGHPTWGVLADRTMLAVGDYLIGSEGTFFLIAQQSLLPTAAVSCNRVISISRPTGPTPGSNAYGGVNNHTPIVTSWPASVLQGTKGERGDVQLPGDVRMPWVSILIPAPPGVQIRFGDVVTDDQATPIRYTISGAELTDLGYRITAAQTTA